MNRKVELRSDTFTLPTPEMREAMATAELGDEQYSEDPTVIKLETMAAEILGKEAALFVSSGTMGNLVAALAHCEHGDEVILDANSHQANSETSNLSFVGGLMVRPLQSYQGILDPDDIEAAIRPPKRTAPKTGLITFENTHADAGGIVVHPDKLKAISRVAHKHGIPVFMDGARIFNASVALGVDVKQLTQHVDSLSFCLSKGLACPAGSVVAGTADFIERASRFKQMIGGYMRQTGILAAAGIVALETMINRLAEDHENARTLGEGIAQIEGLRIDLKPLQTNIIFVDVDKEMGIDAYEFTRRAADLGVRGRPEGASRIRMVTHYGVSHDDIIYALDVLGQVAGST